MWRAQRRVNKERLLTSRQDKPIVRRYGAAAVAWLATCCAAVCVSMLGTLSIGDSISSAEIETSFIALVVGQALFMVFVWPLFERRVANDGENDLPGLGARLLALLALSLPLVLLTLRTAEVRAGSVVWSQVLIFVMGLASGVAVRLPRSVSWYMPSAFLLSAVVPLAAYLLVEEGGVSAGWAVGVSPLWAAGAVASGAALLVPLLVFAGLGAAAGLSLLLARVAPSDQG